MSDAVLSLPPRPYLRDEVYRRLREYVARFADDSGSPVALREADLARALGVSRTPVREALNRLHQEGIVQVQPRRGAKVLPSSTDDYLCWLEIREVLEGAAARRAAERMTPEVVAELRALFAPFTKARANPEADPLAFFEANARFHSRIIEVSDTPLLQRLGSAYDYMGSGRQRAKTRMGRIAQAVREHLEIIDALERRDAEKAEKLSRQHVRGLREAVLARHTAEATANAALTKTRPARKR
jgi:DNA-binding GntR family transcriptional regulator